LQPQVITSTRPTTPRPHLDEIDCYFWAHRRTQRAQSGSCDRRTAQLSFLVTGQSGGDFSSMAISCNCGARASLEGISEGPLPGQRADLPRLPIARCREVSGAPEWRSNLVSAHRLPKTGIFAVSPGDFRQNDPYLAKSGAWRPSTESRKPAIGGRFSYPKGPIPLLKDCLAGVRGFELAHSRSNPVSG